MADSTPNWKIIPNQHTKIGTSDNISTHSNSDYEIVTDLVYPYDLQNDVTKRNYMVFHINVNQDSKFVRHSKDLKDVVVRNGTSRISETISEPLNRAVDIIRDNSIEGIFKTGINELMTNQQMQKVFKEIDNKADFLKDSMTTKPLKRLKGSIMLYMPINVGASYGVNYSDMGGMGILGSLASAAQNKDTLEAALSSSSQVLARIGAKITASGIENVANAIGLDANTLGNFNNAISAASRKTFNPRKEQLFQDVQFRRFSYRFDFAPRTQMECETVVKIIGAFKFHMHPEIDPSYFFYMYPSEFDIEYHIFDQGENPYMNKISSCVLESMDVQYGPGTNWSTLVNGCPSQVHLSLNFVEIVPLNKNMISDGDY